MKKLNTYIFKIITAILVIISIAITACDLSSGTSGNDNKNGNNTTGGNKDNDENNNSGTGNTGGNGDNGEDNGDDEEEIIFNESFDMDETTWTDAVNAIRNGGGNKNYKITFADEDELEWLFTGGSEYTFGTAKDIIVYIEGDATITSPASGQGSLLRIGEDQTVIIKDITLQGKSGNNAPLVYVDDKGTFRMTGNSKVTGNTSSSTRGGGVYVYFAATFIMQDNAEVSDNHVIFSGSYTSNVTDPSLGGGGVHVNGTGTGTFIMKDNASVKNNSATNNATNGRVAGGGVSIYNGTFIMQDNASVKDNTLTATQTGASACGGGVNINSGSFTMENGFIIDNIITTNQAYGGGVYTNVGSLSDDKIFKMKNGTISNNIINGGSIAYGGGVYGELTIEDGTISYNEVYANSSGSNVEARGGGVNGVVIMKGGKISNNIVTCTRTGSSSSSYIYSCGGAVYGSLTMQNGILAGNKVSGSNNNGTINIWGGGACITSTINKTGGTIYGNNESDDELKNIATNGTGHAAYYIYYSGDQWRNTTAGPTVNSADPGFWTND